MAKSLIPKPPADKPLIWKDTDDLPQNEDLLIVFMGLLSFSYLNGASTHDQLHCEVGVFNKNPKHELRIAIEGGDCNGQRYHYTHAQIKQLKGEKFRIGIVGANADVNFYQVGALFNRATATNLKDFRWLVDVETPDLYNDETRNKGQKKAYTPKLLVKNGTFFTMGLTDYSFMLEERNGTAVQLLGKVANVTAVKIKLGAAQRVRFDFKEPNRASRTCMFSQSSTPAKIFFYNLCYEPNGSPCEDGDSHLHTEAFDPPHGKNHYDLVLDTRVSASKQTQQKPKKSLNLPAEMEAKRSTDDAPCHSQGYGQSGGGTGG